MPWVEVFAVFAVSHLTGDFLLQTNRQAMNKFGGLRRGPVERRALFSHVALYTLTFVPALVWLGQEHSVAALVATAVAIFVPHLVVDDGWVVTQWLRRVKHSAADPGEPLHVYVDQSLHLLMLFALAAVVGT